MQFLTRRHRRTIRWDDSFAFVLLNYVIYLALALLWSNRRPLTSVDHIVLVGGLALAPLASGVVVGSRLIHARFLTLVSQTVTDNITNSDAVEDLHSWLRTVFSLKTQLVITVIPGTVAACVSAYLTYRSWGIVPTPEGLLFSVLCGIEGAVYLCTGYAIMAFPHRLSHYPLTLYAINPSDSELIERLSDLLNLNILFFGLYASGLTFVLWTFNIFRLDTTIIMLSIQWFLTALFFTIGQYTMSNIIVRTKRKKLNEIQARIVAIDTHGDLANKETMEALQRLIEYHDRIAHTRNSALDVSSILRFLQSLLLPLLASIVTNINELIELFTP